MGNKLLIVESPGKCNTIRKLLGKDYMVTASVGHIQEIPRKGLNIDVKNGFKPTLIISEDKKKIAKSIKDSMVELVWDVLASSRNGFTAINLRTQYTRQDVSRNDSQQQTQKTFLGIPLGKK